MTVNSSPSAAKHRVYVNGRDDWAFIMGRQLLRALICHTTTTRFRLEDRPFPLTLASCEKIGMLSPSDLMENLTDAKRIPS
jgi:hypothetical protein